MNGHNLIRIEEYAPGIVYLVLNDQARRNAMSEEMAVEFRATIELLKQRIDLKVLILTGAGTAFSAGGDFGLLERCSRLPVAETQTIMRRFYENFLILTELEPVTLAAINGPAFGAGLCLAMACDLRIVGQEVKLALNFSRLSLHPGMGATYFLPRLVGMTRAKELLLTGRTFDGQEAERIGLVIKAVPQERVLPESESMAASIAVNDLTTLRLIKQTLSATLHSELDSILTSESYAQGACYETAAFKETMVRLQRKSST